MKKVNQIIWDFDGVIIISDQVRVKGFEIIFEDYPRHQVEELLLFHEKNGGLSRYVKIRYFFEEILKKSISIEEVNAFAERFSQIMKKELTNKELINDDWLAFMKNYGCRYQHHIASGSDGNELRFLCEELGIADYYLSINGSPTPKKQLVNEILNKSVVERSETILIGDAVNDFDAAVFGKIDFYGYNNKKLLGLGQGYLHSISESFLTN